MKIGDQHTPYTRINSKWIKNLNVSHETIKFLEENLGSKISDVLLSKIFANVFPSVRETKEKINKWDYIKLYIKSFYTAKETINKMKRQPTVWEGIFANDTSDKELIFKMYEELIQYNSTPRRQKIQFKNGQRT